MAVHLVQRRRTRRGRALAAAALTASAVVLPLLALALPARPQDLHPSAFVRLPLEALVLLALLAALPARRVRATVAVGTGLVLGLATVTKLLDLGFQTALYRPFDPLVDWRYAGALLETARSSSPAAAAALVALAVALPLICFGLLPLAVRRVAQVVAEHRRTSVRVVAVLSAAWVVVGLAGVRTAGGPVSSFQTSATVSTHLRAVPAELRARRQFALAVATDPARLVPPADVLAGLQGKDVLVVFVESFGRVATEGSSMAPSVDAVLDQQTRALAAAGVGSRSAYLTSPTFGGLSWLAHSTLQSGTWVDDGQRYDQLLASRRLTLSRLFGRAGWRTVAVVPANDRAWPQGRFYGFDRVYDSRNLGYRGPRFGYPTMPDQYTLAAFARRELAPAHRRPVMAEIDLLSSHAPWAPTPRMVPPAAVGDGSVFAGMPQQVPSQAQVWRSTAGVRAAYAASVRYSVEALTSFVLHSADPNLVVLMLGDHQPAAVVSGPDAGHDVPVALLSRDPAVLRRISSWGWHPGLRPAPSGPVWRMDGFRDRFLAAFGSSDTGVGTGR